MDNFQSNRIATALLLAAGKGSRLHPMTDDSPKCLTEINGHSFIERLVHTLRSNGVRRLVVVVGHLDHCIRDYLESIRGDLQIEYIENRAYRTTNNIYSLWLARERIQEPFLLVECDLIFDADLLVDMLEPDRIAVSHRLPWMNGSTVTLCPRQRVAAFHKGNHSSGSDATFKTVNIYSFSLSTWRRITERLSRHIAGGKLIGYYETVLAELVAENSLSLEAVFFDPDRWYEVDTLEDLQQAESLFSTSWNATTPEDDPEALCAVS